MVEFVEMIKIEMSPGIEFANIRLFYSIFRKLRRKRKVDIDEKKTHLIDAESIASAELFAVHRSERRVN